MNFPDNQDATSETYDSSSCNSQKESTVTGWTTDHAHDHDADDKRNIYCTRPIFPSGNFKFSHGLVTMIK